MKKIFICEFVTGGGYINKKISKKLYKQANIILKSLLNDFNKISNLKILYTSDQRFKKIKVKNAKCFFIKKKPLKKWSKLIKQADYFFPIAPETNKNLLKLIKLNKFNTKVISNKINAIKKTSSKYKTYKFFKKNSIPTLKTFKKNEIQLKSTKKWVTKPDDGAGCENNYIFKKNKKLNNFLKLNKNFITQPFKKGVSYSENVFPLKKKPLILNFNKQKVYFKKKKIIFKKTKVEKKIPIKNKIKKNINIIYKKLPNLNSFFGVDFLISKKKIFFIEINPRITTSYNNINKNLRINIAKKFLKNS